MNNTEKQLSSNVTVHEARTFVTVLTEDLVWAKISMIGSENAGSDFYGFGVFVVSRTAHHPISAESRCNVILRYKRELLGVRKGSLCSLSCRSLSQHF